MEPKRVDLGKSGWFRLGCLALILAPISVCTFQLATETPSERAAREQHRERLNAARAKQAAAEDAADAAAKAAKSAERQAQRDKAEAIAMTKEFVKRRLKAPASADFASTLNHQANRSVDGAWVVTGYVEAQNSFGAQIRTRYVCKLKRVDDSGNWQLVELLM